MTLQHYLELILLFSALTLLYVYGIYPLLMWAIGAVFGRASSGQTAAAEPLPRVSLIIPAYNEEEVIEAKIANALSLDYPQELLEIIVACDGLEDATADIAARYESPTLKVLRFPQRRGKTSVLNDSVAQSSSEVICLCDANVMFQTSALKILVNRLQRTGVGAVSGDVRLDSASSSFGAAESIYYRMERSIHRGESCVGSMMGVDGGMYVLHRQLWEPLPENTILDDFSVSMNVIRKRKKIWYEPSAIAIENATEAAATEFRRRVRLSTGAAQILLRGHFPSLSQPVDLFLFVSHKMLRWISPFVLLVASGSLLALAIENDLYRMIGAFFVGVTCLALLGALSVGLRRSVLFAVPFYFWMSQIAIGYGTICGLCGQASPKWPRTSRSLKEAQAE